MKKIAMFVLTLYVVAGCAARLGPIDVAFAVGNASVTDCPTSAAPDCRAEVKGGPLSEGFDSLLSGTLGRAIDAAARFFHAGEPAVPAPVIVIPQKAPAIIIRPGVSLHEA